MCVNIYIMIMTNMSHHLVRIDSTKFYVYQTKGS